jgi:hypothetical protein
MKKPPTPKPQPLKSAGTLYTPVLPRLPKRMRLLVNAAIAAHGGLEHMSLNEWREVEQELKQKLQSDPEDPFLSRLFHRIPSRQRRN